MTLKALQYNWGWMLVLALMSLLSDRAAFAQAFGFGPPAALNTNAATDSGNDFIPQFVTDSLGNWVAVWESLDSLGGTIGTDSDILVARSTDNGATWSAPTALNSNAASDSSFTHDSAPHVTTDGVGNWVVVWHFLNPSGGTFGFDNDIMVARSTNNGATWTASAPLNSNATIDSGHDYIPRVTTDGLGNWIAVWGSLDSFGGTIGTDYDIFYARSTNNGATWTAPAVLNTNAATDLGPDLSPYVATDGAGNWITMWHSFSDFDGLGTDADILVSRSTNNGVTWTAPAPLNTNVMDDTWHDYQPKVATDGAGNWVAVWTSENPLGFTIGTDRDIFVARSTNNGVSWTTPAVLNSNAVGDIGADGVSQIATDGAGNWIVVWDSNDSLGGTIGFDRDIFFAYSTDNGETWSVTAALNSNATTDSGDDVDPQIMTDRARNWVFVWRSTDTLGGAIGTDEDILFSTSNSASAELGIFSRIATWSYYE